MSIYSNIDKITMMILLTFLINNMGAMGETNHYVGLCSGGGIRSSVACFLTSQIMNYNTMYGVSGGAWGQFWLQNYDKITLKQTIMKKIEANGKWGPNIPVKDVGHAYQEWRQQILDEIVFNNDSPKLRDSFFSVVQVKGDTSGQCFMNCTRIYCPNIHVGNGMMNQRTYDDIKINFNSNGYKYSKTVDYLDRLALSSSAFECQKWLPDLFKIYLETRNKHTIEVKDGGCDNNLAINFYEEEHRRTNNGNIYVWISDNSFYPNIEKRFFEGFKLYNRLRSVDGFIDTDSVTFAEKLQLIIDCVNNGKTNCDTFVISNLRNKNNCLKLFYLPLYGISLKWDLIKKYPTMNGHQANTWNKDEFTFFWKDVDDYITSIKRIIGNEMEFCGSYDNKLTKFSKAKMIKKIRI